MTQLPCGHDAEQEMAVVGDEVWCAECDSKLEVEVDHTADVDLVTLHNWRPVELLPGYDWREVVQQVWGLWETDLDGDSPMLLMVFGNTESALGYLREHWRGYVPVKVSEDRWDVWKYDPEGSVKTGDAYDYGPPMYLSSIRVHH
jgi:hypothetical protein